MIIGEEDQKPIAAVSLQITSQDWQNIPIRVMQDRWIRHAILALRKKTGEYAGQRDAVPREAEESRPGSPDGAATPLQNGV